MAKKRHEDNGHSGKAPKGANGREERLQDLLHQGPPDEREEHEEADLNDQYLPMSKEALAEADHYTQRQLLMVVREYERVQKMRIKCRNAEAACQRGSAGSVDRKAPDDVFSALHELCRSPRGDAPLVISEYKKRLEAQEVFFRRVLDRAVKAQPLGRWLYAVHGVGTVVAGTLLAYTDFHRCCCADTDLEGNAYRWKRGKDRLDIPEHRCPGLVSYSHLLTYAGVSGDQERVWEKGDIRPHNARLKCVLIEQLGGAWNKLVPSPEKAKWTVEQTEEEVNAELTKAGKLTLKGLALRRRAEERIKRRLDAAHSYSLPGAFYVRTFHQWKIKETRMNEEGRLKEAADRMLERARAGRWQITDLQRKTWEAGRLQPIGIHYRAVRRALNLFLSHFHEVGYLHHFGVPGPGPYAMAQAGHSHYIPPPFTLAQADGILRDQKRRQAERAKRAKEGREAEARA